MKKLILGLLCIGTILALPGCCCRRTCEEPCEEYYDDCYDECDTDYCDDGHHHHDDGKELIGYEEQQGYRRNIYRKDHREVAAPAAPRKATYHKPIHPAVIEKCEADGKNVRYLDERFEHQNMQMREAAEAKEKPVVPATRQSRKSMRSEASTAMAE